MKPDGRSMNLDTVQRRILANQYRIFSMLAKDSEDQGHYQYCAEILEHGYEFLYYKIFDSIEQPAMDKEESIELVKILTMYESLGDSYDNLSDKSGIDEIEIKFTGFDGNGDEVRYKNFVSFHCNIRSMESTDPSTQGSGDVLFPSVFRRSPKWYMYNVPQLEGYRAMLKEWAALTKDGSWRAEHLAKIQIQQIIAAKKKSSKEG